MLAHLKSYDFRGTRTCKKQEAEGRKEGRKNVKLFALPLLHTIWWWCLNDNIQSDSGKYHQTCAALILNKSTIHRIDTALLDGLYRNMICRGKKYLLTRIFGNMKLPKRALSKQHSYRSRWVHFIMVDGQQQG